MNLVNNGKRSGMCTKSQIQKTKGAAQTWKLVLFICLFVACSVFQSKIRNVITFFVPLQNSNLTSSILVAVASQLQLLLTVLLTIKCKRSGYIASIILCLLNALGVTYNLVVYHELYDSLGYVCIGMAIVVTTVLYYQLSLLTKNSDSMHKLAFEDDLTCLPNRKRFLSNLTNRTVSHEKLCSFSLVFIDLDNFKEVNDSLGHQVGDIFLKEVAHNLEECLSQDDFIARLGGDEFGIIIPEEHTNADLYKYAQKMSDAISTPFIYRNKEIKITASFGITQYPKDGTNATELLQQTDMAMYRGKSLGKGRITFFNQEMQKSLEKRLDIESQLRNAIENNELYLEYQPQYDALTHRLRGFEALARWTSPTLGRVEPKDFIPISEENGDIVAIGKWIMETACRQYMAVYDSYESLPMLAINISAVQLRDPDFLDSVKRIINKTKMDTDHLELEITESVCIMAPEIISQIFAQLKNMGIEIAMDDFGTGYSSLSYLRNLPLDVVKIDISFTRTILTTPPEKNLIKTIIAMAHQLGLKVIAEGVEVNDQLIYLQNNGCDYIQGNLFGKPAPIGAL